MNRIQTGGYRYTKKSKANSKKDKVGIKNGGYKSGSYLSAYKRSRRRRSTMRRGHK